MIERGSLVFGDGGPEHRAGTDSGWSGRHGGEGVRVGGIVGTRQHRPQKQLIPAPSKCQLMPWTWTKGKKVPSSVIYYSANELHVS